MQPAHAGKDSQLFITIEALQAAVIRCMEKEPPKDHVLSPDSSNLVDVFQDVRYRRSTGMNLEDFPAKARAAFERWSQ
jgi:hypothetical protein